MRALSLLLFTAALAWGQAPPAEPAADGPSVVQLIDTALQFAKKTAAAMGGAYTFQVAQPPHLPPLPPGRLSFEASHLSKQEPVGRFFVVVAVKVDGQRAAMARVDLDGNWVGKLFRAKQNLARKTPLTMDQVESSPFSGVPPEGALTTLPSGQRLRAPVIEGHILTRADLEPIPLVRFGDRVRLTATSDTLTIGLDTVARSRGGLGDRVRLESPKSHRMITAVVTGPGEARMEN